MKQIIRKCDGYQIILDGEDFHVIKKGELLLTTISFDKADNYFYDCLSLEKLINRKKLNHED